MMKIVLPMNLKKKSLKNTSFSNQKKMMILLLCKKILQMTLKKNSCHHFQHSSCLEQNTVWMSLKEYCIFSAYC